MNGIYQHASLVSFGTKSGSPKIAFDTRPLIQYSHFHLKVNGISVSAHSYGENSTKHENQIQVIVYHHYIVKNKQVLFF